MEKQPQKQLSYLQKREDGSFPEGKKVVMAQIEILTFKSQNGWGWKRPLEVTREAQGARTFSE